MTKVTGLAIFYGQGDLKGNSFVPHATEADFDTIKAGFEASGEITVLGYTVCNIEEVEPAAVAGTAGIKLVHKQFGLKNAAGLTVATMIGKFPDDDAKITAMTAVAKAKTIAGQAIDSVTEKVAPKTY